MRKLLLLLSFLVTFGTLLAQSDVTFNFTNLYGASTISDLSAESKTVDDVTISYEKGNSSSSPAYNKSGEVRLYGGKSNTVLDGNKMTVSVPAGTKITKIILNHGSSCTWGTLTADNGSLEISSSHDATWTGDSESVIFTLSRNASATGTSTQWRIKTAVVTVKAGDPTAVTPPTITLGENNMVSIEQADGADIYYTTNEEDPTTASALYTGPFAITTTTTIKAIAVLNGKASAVSTKVLKPNTLSSLAEFLELQPTGETKVNTPLTAIYQCGRNLYLTDGSDFILSYNDNDVADVKNLGAVNGDVISFISGTYLDKNGLSEIIPSAIGEKTAGTAVTPEELAIEELSTNMLNKYVRITDVSIVAATSANNYTVTDSTGTIVLYNTFNNASYYPEAITLPDGTKGNEIPEGEGFTIEGFVSIFRNTLQITPISITGGNVMETVATPTFTPVSGSALDAGAQITIECETPGATIYYTTDETAPSASSQEYTGELTFTEDVTIKAIAVKDGMLDSDVATATYTLKVAGQETATFDFTATGNASTLTTSTIAASKENTADASNILTGATFTNGPIELQIGKGNGTSHPRWWIENSGNDIRAYQNNEIVVKVCEDGYRIESIEYSQISGSNGWASSWTVVPADGAWSGKKWTAPADSKLNQVSMIPAGASRIAKVNVVYVEDSGAVSGIEDLDVDNSNAPVEYYNLQGIRISADNLTPGIYIRRQGSDVVKVLVK